MRLEVGFVQSNQTLDIDFGEVHNISDGGYERGYAEGEEVGYNQGYGKGFSDGNEEGYETGKTDGYGLGHSEGYNQGLTEGTEIGYNTGYTNGVNEGHAEGYTDGYNFGHADGYNEAKAEEETLFTTYGTMYKRNMVVTADGTQGFRPYTYWKADKMETLETPNLQEAANGQGYVFQDCTALKTASLPKIQRIGVRFFYNCTALEELTLGCEEYPMVAIGNNAFQNCSGLVRLNLIGTIANTMTFQFSPLSVESMKMVIASLVNLTGTGNEYAYTVKFSEECWAALEADSTAPDGCKWRDYVVSALCWTT